MLEQVATVWDLLKRMRTWSRPATTTERTASLPRRARGHEFSPHASQCGEMGSWSQWPAGSRPDEHRCAQASRPRCWTVRAKQWRSLR